MGLIIVRLWVSVIFALALWSQLPANAHTPLTCQDWTAHLVWTPD